jgi:hypothetical protein
MGATRSTLRKAQSRETSWSSWSRRMTTTIFQPVSLRTIRSQEVGKTITARRESGRGNGNRGIEADASVGGCLRQAPLTEPCSVAGRRPPPTFGTILMRLTTVSAPPLPAPHQSAAATLHNTDLSNPADPHAGQTPRCVLALERRSCRRAAPWRADGQSE